MYKAQAQNGFELLDEYHSPDMTARYIKGAGEDRAVIEVRNSGRLGDWNVYRVLETASSPVKWDDAVVVAQEQVADGVDEELAWEAARKLMTDTGWVRDLKKSGRFQADSDFMF